MNLNTRFVETECEFRINAELKYGNVSEIRKFITKKGILIVVNRTYYDRLNRQFCSISFEILSDQFYSDKTDQEIQIDFDNYCSKKLIKTYPENTNL